MKAIKLLLSFSLLSGCGSAEPATGTIIGRVDDISLAWATSIEALGAGGVASHVVDEDRSFRITVEAGASYQLQLVDAKYTRRELVAFFDGRDRVDVPADGTPVDVGAIRSVSDTPQADGPLDRPNDRPDGGMDDDGDDGGNDDDDDGGDDDGDHDGGMDDGGDDGGHGGDRCEVDVADCRFSTYNLEVQVGDRFVLTNFLERCNGRVGVDFRFDYEDNEDWNLDAFNNDDVVEIVEEDLDGGNHGDGEYRFFLYVDGDEVDHMTIRIEHGEESDIGPNDDVPPSGSESSDECNEEATCSTDEDCHSGMSCTDGVCRGT